MNALLGCMNALLGCMNALLGCMNALLGCMNALPGCMNALPGCMNALPGCMNALPGCMNALPGCMNARLVCTNARRPRPHAGRSTMNRAAMVFFFIVNVVRKSQGGGFAVIVYARHGDVNMLWIAEARVSFSCFFYYGVAALLAMTRGGDCRGDERLAGTPSLFLFSGAARRMVESPLPAFGHPLARQAGEGRNSSEEFVIAKSAATR
ncbi:MAG: hypothetical protein LBF50_10000 [Azoarcus sp.]|jgi:hypothetical protein|nr:hypothetical protein [Azoarcus sp.]